MASASAVVRCLVAVLALLAAVQLPVRAGGGGSGRCARVQSMTSEQACAAVCGTRHMLELCLRTLPLRRLGASAGAPVTSLAAAAVRGALGSYAATAAVAMSLMDGGTLADGEKAAYDDCMVGYGSARVAMARVAGDLESGCPGAADLKPGYTAGLSGMDSCRRSMLDYPASPLHAMNLADRNKTLLAALLCSLVPSPTGGRRQLQG